MSTAPSSITSSESVAEDEADLQQSLVTRSENCHPHHYHHQQQHQQQQQPNRRKNANMSSDQQQQQLMFQQQQQQQLSKQNSISNCNGNGEEQVESKEKVSNQRGRRSSKEASHKNGLNQVEVNKLVIFILVQFINRLNYFKTKTFSTFTNTLKF